MHCIIAYAASAHLPPDALDGLHLPRLSALLNRLQRTGQDHDPADDQPPAAMPHERAHASALGWDSHAPHPWAAWQTGTTGPQAWITPCHWQIGMDQVFMLDPAALQLTDEESQALLQAMQPWLQEDGLQVRWHDALHWHASGDMLGGWSAASLDRVIGANVRPWITSGLPGALVRLQSEMQMLAYNHPVNDARLARGQLPVNAFWVHGAGSLPQPTPAGRSVQYLDDLRAHILRGDVQGWRAAWQLLDTRLPAPDTPGLQLTLCSESAAHLWQARPAHWLARLQKALRPTDTTLALKALIDT
jgi:hypothetical protein